MTFSDTQIKRLKAKLDHARVKTRAQDGRDVAYVEGWYAIAEANRIFGFDGWDRITLPHQLLYERKGAGGQTECAYLARVRIVVRAENHVVVREGSGFGSATRVDPGEAHDIALKTAETDATKRALATFGNRFGLALYDKEQAGVSKPRRTPRASASSAVLPSVGMTFASAAPGEATASSVIDVVPAEEPARDQRGPSRVSADEAGALQSAVNYIQAVRERVLKSTSITELDVCMTSARGEFDRLREAYPDLRNRRGVHFCDLVVSIAELRASDLERGRATRTQLNSDPLRLRVDKTSLPFGTSKRHRNKDHLIRVAALPCIICGRTPSQAHHVRYAQDRGIGLKVSDEFVVPLCAIDHDALHRSGNERQWWANRNIDPLPVVRKLWATSRANPTGTEPEDETNSSAFAPSSANSVDSGTTGCASGQPQQLYSSWKQSASISGLSPGAVAVLLHVIWLSIVGPAATDHLPMAQAVVAYLTLNLLAAAQPTRPTLLASRGRRFQRARLIADLAAPTFPQLFRSCVPETDHMQSHANSTVRGSPNCR